MWGSGVGNDGWRCCCADPYSLWSVTEEVVCPVDDKWGDVEVLECLYHLIMLHSVECRTEVNKEDSNNVSR